ncbi:hypothetical protein [Flavobacterium panacagri]|uniref:hypothetical protein n=1 Tax=Flavobacterium panacagri TaxID=3034146 RepID=UPI0025A60E6E|nr:hypothetical protein [Flavobacterium panacagri]
MKNTLLLFSMTFAFLQQIQSQTSQELLEKKQNEWNYSYCVNCAENPFTFDQTIIKYFIANVYDKDNRNSFGASRDENDSDEEYKTKVAVAKTAIISMEVFTDSTASKKIGVVKLNQILPTEIFVMVASKEYYGQKMLKSLKDKKIYVINDYAFDFRDYHYTSGGSVVKKYTDPQALQKEKLAVANYRIMLNNAVSTVNQIESIQKKHTYQRVNQYGHVIATHYDTTKFTQLEVVSYKKLLKKLKEQRENVITKNKEKVGNKSLQYDLLDISDFGKQTRIEDAYQTYINDFGYIE